MKPGADERKWETPSLWLSYPLIGKCNIGKRRVMPLSLMRYGSDMVTQILAVFRDQQRKEGNGNYRFLRVTDRSTDGKK